MWYPLLAFILTSCITHQPEKFKMPTGDIKYCYSYSQEPCGMSMEDCGEDDTGGTLTFECMTDVIYYGPVGKTKVKGAKK